MLSAPVALRAAVRRVTVDRAGSVLAAEFEGGSVELHALNGSHRWHRPGAEGAAFLRTAELEVDYCALLLWQSAEPVVALFATGAWLEGPSTRPPTEVARLPALSGGGGHWTTAARGDHLLCAAAGSVAVMQVRQAACEGGVSLCHLYTVSGAPALPFALLGVADAAGRLSSLVVGGGSERAVAVGSLEDGADVEWSTLPLPGPDRAAERGAAVEDAEGSPGPASRAVSGTASGAASEPPSGPASGRATPPQPRRGRRRAAEAVGPAPDAISTLFQVGPPAEGGGSLVGALDGGGRAWLIGLRRGGSGGGGGGPVHLLARLDVGSSLVAAVAWSSPHYYPGGKGERRGGAADAGTCRLLLGLDTKQTLRLHDVCPPPLSSLPSARSPSAPVSPPPCLNPSRLSPTGDRCVGWTCELAALAAARQGRRRLAVARRSRRRGRGHRLSHRLATRRCPGAAAMCASLARAPPAD